MDIKDFIEGFNSFMKETMPHNTFEIRYSDSSVGDYNILSNSIRSSNKPNEFNNLSIDYVATVQSILIKSLYKDLFNEIMKSVRDYITQDISNVSINLSTDKNSQTSLDSINKSYNNNLFNAFITHKTANDIMSSNTIISQNKTFYDDLDDVIRVHGKKMLRNDKVLDFECVDDDNFKILYFDKIIIYISIENLSLETDDNYFPNTSTIKYSLKAFPNNHELFVDIFDRNNIFFQEYRRRRLDML